MVFKKKIKCDVSIENKTFTNLFTLKPIKLILIENHESDIGIFISNFKKLLVINE